MNLSIAPVLALLLAPPEAQSQAAVHDPDAPAPSLVAALDEPEDTLADEPLAQLPAFIPGAGVLTLGGLGPFGAVSPRASGGAQVYLDGAPLTTGLAALDELALLLDDPSTTLEVHRSLVPAAYGAAAGGAALDIVSPDDAPSPRAWIDGGFGSFSTRRARAGVIFAPRSDLTLVARGGYAGSRGDFWHFDDVGTPFLFGDDDWRRRANNGYDEGFVQLRLAHRGEQLRASSQLFAHVRTQGVPGEAGGRNNDARSLRVSARNVSRVRRALPRPGASIEWIGSLAIEGRRLDDPWAELDATRDEERGLSLDAWLSPRLRVPLWYRGVLGLSAQLRGEHVQLRDRFSPPLRADAEHGGQQRLSTNLAIELEQTLYDGRWVLVPALQLDGALTSRASPTVLGSAWPQRSFGFSPRIATMFNFIDGLQLRGAVARTMRLPTLIELHGDRGYLVGGGQLRPESGTHVDGGLWFAREDLGAPAIALHAHALGFVDWTRDLIQWTRVGAAAQAINIERARVRGLELGAGLDAWQGALSLALAYRLLDSENGSEGFSTRDLPLPGRPRHNLWLRVAGGWRVHGPGARRLSFVPRAVYELDLRSANTLDLDGVLQVPARALHALGVSLGVGERVELGVELRNLAGARSTTVNLDGGWPGPYPNAVGDLLGFPLPGRSLWARVRVEVGWL